jgi:hypothetical protein
MYACVQIRMILGSGTVMLSLPSPTYPTVVCSMFILNRLHDLSTDMNVAFSMSGGYLSTAEPPKNAVLPWRKSIPPVVFCHGFEVLTFL